MIIFTYGQDSYRLSRYRQELTDRYHTRQPDGFRLHCFDLAELTDYSAIHSAVETLSFFKEPVFVVATGGFATKDVAERWLKFLDEHEPTFEKDVTLLVSEPLSGTDLAKKSKGLFSALKTRAKQVIEFDILSGPDLENWVSNKAKEVNLSLSLQNASYLIGLVGNDSWRLANEVSKLAAFCSSGKATKPDIDALVKGESEASVFELIDAIAGTDRQKALTLLYRSIAQGQDPHYLLSMIVHQFRNLLLVKELPAANQASPAQARNLGLHPYVLRKSIGQAKRLSLSRLKSSYADLSALDLDAKDGRRDLEDGLWAFTLAQTKREE